MSPGRSKPPYLAYAAPAEMMTRIVAAADEFVAGAKQHDDMTIIVAAFA